MEFAAAHQLSLILITSGNGVYIYMCICMCVYYFIYTLGRNENIYLIFPFKINASGNSLAVQWWQHGQKKKINTINWIALFTFFFSFVSQCL